MLLGKPAVLLVAALSIMVSFFSSLSSQCCELNDGLDATISGTVKTWNSPQGALILGPATNSIDTLCDFHEINPTSNWHGPPDSLPY